MSNGNNNILNNKKVGEMNNLKNGSIKYLLEKARNASNNMNNINMQKGSDKNFKNGNVK